MPFIQRLGNPLENLRILSKSTKIKFINDLPYINEGRVISFLLKGGIGKEGLEKKNEIGIIFSLGILGGSRKKIAKKMIPKVPTNKNV
jgi:hypothetical protein